METPKYWSTPATDPTLRAELDLIPSGRRVLEVGTAAGHVTRALTDRGCSVVGVEMDVHQASLAAPYCRRLIVGNIEALDLDVELPDTFDVVLCGDVLEHLRDPGAVLQKLVRRLGPNGYLVVSIPNVAHGSVRLALLAGRFTYTPCGLLDATHLRFFTLSSLVDLFSDNGLAIRDLRRIRKDFFDTELGITPSMFQPPSLIARLLDDVEATTYQFVFRATPSRRRNALVDLTDPDFDRVRARRLFAADAMRRSWIALHDAPPRWDDAKDWARLALEASPTAKAALYWSLSLAASVLRRRPPVPAGD